MTPQELIRKFIELLSDEAPETSSKAEIPTVTLTAVEVDNSDKADTETMISPLQQKLELMKKSVGVESTFDEKTEQSEQSEQSEHDDYDNELAFIKKASGLPVIAVSDASGEVEDQ